MKTIGKHLRDFTLPILVTIVIPLIINRVEHRYLHRPCTTSSFLQMLAGLIVGFSGLGLMIWSIYLMISIAKSTVMPWDPPNKLIISGPYRHLRNPLILGVILLLMGQAFVFASYGIAALSVVFFIGNTLYFILSEEPKLEQQFGNQFREYKENVPMWIPRLVPWQPENKSLEDKTG